MFIYLFFNVEHFKVFIEFVTIIASVLCFGFWPPGIGSLNSWTRDRTSIPCSERLSPNHWTTVLILFIFIRMEKSWVSPLINRVQTVQVGPTLEGRPEFSLKTI